MIKIYKLNFLAKPKGLNFEHFAILREQAKDECFLGGPFEEFSGRPFSRKWKKIKLYVENPQFPYADFSYFRINAFVCNERARELIGEPLEMSGELLPIGVERQDGVFYICNITNCLNAINCERSKWQPAGVEGNLKVLKKPVFIANRIGDARLFKIIEDGGTWVYCVERTGDPEEGEFKALIEKHRLTGIKFELVWTD